MMRDLYSFLSGRLRSAKRLAILGAGSFLRADDAAGVRITEGLRERFSASGLSAVAIFSGESAPENYTGEVKRFAPDSLLVFDAADIGAEPGTIAFIEPEAIGGVSFSTHMLPMKIILDYLKSETSCEVTVIGIQPGSLAYDGRMTEQVSEAVTYVISVMEKLMVRFESYARLNK